MACVLWSDFHGVNEGKHRVESCQTGSSITRADSCEHLRWKFSILERARRVKVREWAVLFCDGVNVREFGGI